LPVLILEKVIQRHEPIVLGLQLRQVPDVIVIFIIRVDANVFFGMARPRKGVAGFGSLGGLVVAIHDLDGLEGWSRGVKGW